MLSIRHIALALGTFLTLGAGAAQANGAVVDAYGDFLPTFTGPANGDLDVIAAAGFYDGAAQTFTFSTILADTVGTTPGALYVWGIDRGLGTERFVTGTPSIGAGVSFDSVLLVRQDGTGVFNDFIQGVVTPLDPSMIHLSSVTVSVEALPLSLFAPNAAGFVAPDQYTWNLWPRVGLGSNSQISDFAPDASNLAFQVTAVPEPESWALFLSGLAVTGFVARQRAREAR